MNENILKIPAVANIGTISTEKLQSTLTIHQPQIIQHLAFLPVETQKINIQLLETIGLIEEFKLEQDLIIREAENQSYDTAVYQNKTNKNIIIPSATHLKGGHQNRGNNQTEVLGIGESEDIDVNCFEPSRGHGDDEFTEFQDTPADVALETMTNTEGFQGTWKIISEYTSLANSGDALSDFNDKTEEDRAKYALNFETCKGQTGAIIITRDLSMIEVFPTANTFNIYRQRILRGKVASLFYRLNKQESETLLLPSEVETKINQMLTIVTAGIRNTIDNGTKKHGLIIGRSRQQNKAIDIILTDTEPKQIAYIFGAW